MIAPEEALAIIQRQITTLRADPIPLAKVANRILREDCIADIDLPPFARATMDGYAVRSVDIADAPTKLEVIGMIAAGDHLKKPIGRGQAAKIMTGAPLPDGADAVQKVEVTETTGDTVVIQESVVAGQNVTPAGSEATKGQTVIAKGTRITAAEIAVLATFGYAEVMVGRKPRVAVMATGTELVDVSEKPKTAQIRNSNNYAISSYAERIGAETTDYGRVVDDEELLTKKLEQALEECDVLLISGGVSMGDYDLVKICLNRLGTEFFFEKIALRPGKPLVFGKLGERFIFGLPGNPVSTTVTFNLFVRPALLQMMGASDTMLPVVTATLLDKIKPTKERRTYLPGTLKYVDGRVEVSKLKWGGSSDLVGFRAADSLIIAPAGADPMKPGQLVDVVVLDR
jgi:molybdenum cofactor synthesis domain-containing protein